MERIGDIQRSSYGKARNAGIVEEYVEKYEPKEIAREQTEPREMKVPACDIISCDPRKEVKWWGDSRNIYSTVPCAECNIQCKTLLLKPPHSSPSGVIVVNVKHIFIMYDGTLHPLKVQFYIFSRNCTDITLIQRTTYSNIMT
jgi:hypothetical protein